MSNPDPDRLANVPLFAGLSDDERATLATWLEVEEFEAGRSPVREHDSGYAFFVLDEGRAHAELDGRVLEVLEPGSVFGEMAFFAADGRRNATIVSDTDVRVLSMFGTRFREMQMQIPDVAARLHAIFEERAQRVSSAQDPH